MKEPSSKEARPSLDHTCLPFRSTQVKSPRCFFPTANRCCWNRIGVWTSEFHSCAAWTKTLSVVKALADFLTRNIAPPAS